MLSLALIAALFSGALAARYTCYGNVSDLSPTGKGGSVSASQSAVSAHAGLARSLRDVILRVASRYCIEPSVIGGIASRESNFGASLDSNGYGDGGEAWGVMQPCIRGQCDIKNSGDDCKKCGTADYCHFDMMTKHLLRDIRAVRNKHPRWSSAQIFQGAVAAYNFHVSNVRTWGGLDIGTTGDDYSNDVMARAQYLKREYSYA